MSSSVMEKETARMEAFSDGVFAIAVTLLILEIKVPDLPGQIRNMDLWRALLNLWPSFLAFTFSFFAILIMWFNHHGFFKLIDRVNKPFFYANGFLLFSISFVPFPTAVLAQYIDTPAAKAAVLFYCGTYLVINVAYNLLWFAAAHNRALIKHGVPQATLFRIRNAYWLGFPVYVLATALVFVNLWLSLLLCLPLCILWATLDYKAE